MRRGLAFFAEDRTRAQIFDVLDAKGLLAGADHAHQLEHLGVHAHRHDQAATDFQLLLQLVGYVRTGKIDQDRVERGVLGPSPAGLAVQDVHVADVLALERGRGGERQPLHGFHGVHAARDSREHRGHVTGAGADLEHLFAALEPHCLDHCADDAGAGDGPPVGEREFRVFVGELADLRGHELFTRHGSQRIQHQVRPNAAACDLAVDHR